MASTPEGLVKLKVRAVLKAAGIYHFSPVTYGMGRSGIPDIITCVNGCFLAIECKAGKGKTTALQEAEMANIRKAGGEAIVIYENNLGHLRETIHRLLTRPQLSEEKQDEEAQEFEETGPAPSLAGT